jgi:hypothetical protein
VLEREDSHAKVTTIKTVALIRRGDREECARTVNDSLDGVRPAHFHGVGGGEVHAPITWLVLHWHDIILSTWTPVSY